MWNGHLLPCGRSVVYAATERKKVGDLASSLLHLHIHDTGHICKSQPASLISLFNKCVCALQFKSLRTSSELCLELPGVTKGHLGNLDVHLYKVVRWTVPPVSNCLFVGCGDV